MVLLPILKEKYVFFEGKGLCLNDDITICRKGSLKRTLSIAIPSRGVMGAIERCSI